LGGKGSREISRVGSGISGMLPKNLYCITPFAGNGREGREGARGEGRGSREAAKTRRGEERVEGIERGVLVFSSLRKPSRLRAFA